MEKNRAKRRDIRIKVAYIVVLLLVVITSVLFFTAKDKGPPVSDGNDDAQPVQTDIPAEDDADSSAADNYIEDASFVNDTGAVDSAQYVNNSVLTCDYGNGKHISIGINDASLTDAIYLNLQCSEATEAHPVIFCVTSSRVTVKYSNALGTDANAGTNADYNNYICVGRTYDFLIPSQTISASDYGGRWFNDPFEDGVLDTGTELYIRAIQLNREDYTGGTLLAVLKATVSFDASSNTYSLAGFESNDVRETGALSEDERVSIVIDAISFIRDDSRGDIWIVPDNLLLGIDETAIVEQIPQTYYKRLLTSSNEDVPRGKFANCDIYAVNLNTPAFGCITIYYAPRAQTIGLNTLGPDSTELNLTAFGYDPVFPFTTQTFQGPESFITIEQKNALLSVNMQKKED